MKVGSGHWTRWGRDDCEGYALSIGNLLRFSISANAHKQKGVVTWDASLNAYFIGNFETFEDALFAVDREARTTVGVVIEHWNTYLDSPAAKRRHGKRRQ